MPVRVTCAPEERAQRERFEALYVRAQSPVMLTIERSVCGCDYGGNSWTTQAEAQQIAAVLGLQPGRRLLDLGAGSGWPALYMAKSSGCDLVLIDLPLAGIRIARERADNDGLSGKVGTFVADAAALPFPDESFDAISHSDLLCCLRQKCSVLAACRRVIRRHGHMAFTVISVAPGLSPEQYRRAVANGPEFIETGTDYRKLLDQTGWNIAGHQDVTTSYVSSCQRQLDADEAQKEGLIGLVGNSEYAERTAGWRSKLAALGDNLLRRELFIAEPGTEWTRTPAVVSGP